jgi:hypothetical protein
MIEEWRDVRGYEGLYMVSNLGRIKSLERIYYSGKSRKSRKIQPESILKIRSIGKYLGMCLFKNGRRSTRYVHRVVASAFIPNLDNLPEVNHKNANKHDNAIENLEWCTKEGNLQHARENGLLPGKGAKHPKAIFNNDDILSIRLLRSTQNLSGCKLAKMYNANPVTIYNIINRKSYANI